jgi:branched-subunit amino acid aminotransferase/4-amino-4-deoxychorismate lyase
MQQVTAAKVTLEDVLMAREVFLTSTTKRAVPIVQVNDMRIGTGKPGPVVQQVLEELVKREVL